MSKKSVLMFKCFLSSVSLPGRVYLMFCFTLNELRIQAFPFGKSAGLYCPVGNVFKDLSAKSSGFDLNNCTNQVYCETV